MLCDQLPPNEDGAFFECILKVIITVHVVIGLRRVFVREDRECTFQTMRLVVTLKLPLVLFNLPCPRQLAHVSLHPFACNTCSSGSKDEQCHCCQAVSVYRF